MKSGILKWILGTSVCTLLLVAVQLVAQSETANAQARKATIISFDAPGAGINRHQPRRSDHGILL